MNEDHDILVSVWHKNVSYLMCEQPIRFDEKCLQVRGSRYNDVVVDEVVSPITENKQQQE